MSEREDLERRLAALKKQHELLEIGYKSKFAVCLTRAFDVGETQQKLYDNIHTKQRAMAKSEAEKIIVAEKELKNHCNVDTDEAVKIMENIVVVIEKEDTEKLERRIINHDTEIVEALRKAIPKEMR